MKEEYVILTISKSRLQELGISSINTDDAVSDIVSKMGNSLSELIPDTFSGLYDLGELKTYRSVLADIAESYYDTDEGETIDEVCMDLINEFESNGVNGLIAEEQKHLLRELLQLIIPFKNEDYISVINELISI